MRFFAFLVIAFAGSISAAQVREYRYTHGELKAQVIHRANPAYPLEARRTHQQGQGYFRLYVARDGNVTTVKVIKSTGHDLLDDSCLKAFKSWQLKPGFRREIDVPVSFIVSRYPPPPTAAAERPPTIVREFRD
jgi:TonB family protein